MLNHDQQENRHAQQQSTQHRPGSGAWHIESASVDHEFVHVEQYKDYFTSSFPASQLLIEAHVLGPVASMTEAAASAAMLTYLSGPAATTWLNAFAAESAAVGVVASEIPAYAAGQVDLDIRITEIEVWSAANCP